MKGIKIMKNFNLKEYNEYIDGCRYKYLQEHSRPKISLCKDDLRDLNKCEICESLFYGGKRVFVLAEDNAPICDGCAWECAPYTYYQMEKQRRESEHLEQEKSNERFREDVEKKCPGLTAEFNKFFKQH